jgi:hypothetical protein
MNNGVVPNNSIVEFGDGASGAALNFAIGASQIQDLLGHTYTAAGTYTAKLENSSGNVLGAVTITVTSSNAGQPSATADCQTGTPVIDLQGNPTIATKTATHVYTAFSFDGALDPNNECGTHTLVGADPNTFVALDQFYGKDANGVWFIQNPWSGSEGSATFYQIPGADASTFSLIPDSFLAGPWPQNPNEGFSPWYTKDKNNVYFYGVVVAGADLATFAVDDPPAGTSCDFYDAHDALHFYYRGSLLPPPAQWTNNCP